MKNTFYSSVFAAFCLSCIVVIFVQGTLRAQDNTPPSSDTKTGTEIFGGTALTDINVSVNSSVDSEIKMLIRKLRNNHDVPELRKSEVTEMLSFKYKADNRPETWLSNRPDPFQFNFQQAIVYKKPVDTTPKNGSDNTGTDNTKTPGTTTQPVKPDHIKPKNPPKQNITDTFRATLQNRFEKINSDYFHAVSLMASDGSRSNDARDILKQVAMRCEELNKDIALKPHNLEPYEILDENDPGIMKIKSLSGRLNETVTRMESRMEAVQSFKKLKIEVKGVIARNRGAACIIHSPVLSGGGRGAESTMSGSSFKRTTGIFGKGDPIPNTYNLPVIISEINDDYVVFDFKNMIKIKVEVGKKRL